MISGRFGFGFLIPADPLDPATCRHGPSCAYRDATEVPSGVLKVSEKDGGYWWVECNACQFAWQVPFYAAETEASAV